MFHCKRDNQLWLFCWAPQSSRAQVNEINDRFSGNQIDACRALSWLPGARCARPAALMRAHEAGRRGGLASRRGAQRVGPEPLGRARDQAETQIFRSPAHDTRWKPGLSGERAGGGRGAFCDCELRPPKAGGGRGWGSEMEPPKCRIANCRPILELITMRPHVLGLLTRAQARPFVCSSVSSHRSRPTTRNKNVVSLVSSFATRATRERAQSLRDSPGRPMTYCDQPDARLLPGASDNCRATAAAS